MFMYVIKTTDRHVHTTVLPWQQKNYNLETMSEGNLSNIALDFNILKSTQFVLEMFRCEISEEISYG